MTSTEELDVERQHEPDEAAIERAVAILLRDDKAREGEAA